MKIILLGCLLLLQASQVTDEVEKSLSDSRVKLGIKPLQPSAVLGKRLEACLGGEKSRECNGINTTACSQGIGIFFYKETKYLRICNVKTAAEVTEAFLNNKKARDILYGRRFSGCSALRSIQVKEHNEDVYVVFSQEGQDLVSPLRALDFPFPTCEVAGMEEYIVPEGESKFIDLYNPINQLRVATGLPPIKYSSKISTLAKDSKLTSKNLLCSQDSHTSCRKEGPKACFDYDFTHFEYSKPADLEAIAHKFSSASLPKAFSENYSEHQWLAIGFTDSADKLTIWVAYSNQCKPKFARRMCIAR